MIVSSLLCFISLFPSFLLFAISDVIMPKRFTRFGDSLFQKKHVEVTRRYDRTRKHYQPVGRSGFTFYRNVATLCIFEYQLVDLYHFGGNNAILSVCVYSGTLRHQRSLGFCRWPEHHIRLQSVVLQTDQSVVQSSVRLTLNGFCRQGEWSTMPSFHFNFIFILREWYWI